MTKHVRCAQAMCSLLFLACIALALPSAGAVLYSREKLSEGAILAVSHGTASAFLPENRRCNVRKLLQLKFRFCA